MTAQDGLYHGMCLELNGSTFPRSSSTSSSPDSTRSLSSLDAELQDGTKTVPSEDDSGIQSPDGRPDDNDASVSVYLDANEEGWYDDGDEGKCAICGDSSAADAPLVSSGDEVSGDEEEDSFLSLCSVDVVTKTKRGSQEGQEWSSSRKPKCEALNDKTRVHKPSVDPVQAQQESKECPNEEDRMQRLIHVGEIHQEGLQDSMEHPTALSQSVDLSHEPQRMQSSSTGPGVSDVEFENETSLETTKPPEEDKTWDLTKKSDLSTCTSPAPVSEGTMPSTPAKTPKESEKVSQNANGSPKPPSASLTKSTKTELKRFSRHDLKNVKPKVVSRAASAPRSVNTDAGQSAARGRVTKRVQQGDGGVKSRTMTGSDSKSSRVPRGKRTTESISEERLSSEVLTHEDREDSKSKGVDPRDVDQNPGPPPVAPRVLNRGCASTGLRLGPAAGVPKSRVIDCSVVVCGSALSWKPPQKPASKLPIKASSLLASLSSSSLGSVASESLASRGVAPVMKCDEPVVRPSSFSQGKSASIKPTGGISNRANTLAKGQKGAAHTSQSKNTQNALQRGGTARPGRPSVTVCPSSRGGRSARTAHTNPDEEDERKNQTIQQLRKIVSHGNRKLEALTVVIQHIFREREEALKQKKEISIQLKNLREELAQSVSCCERLESEKASVCRQLDSAVLKLQQQHQAELIQLEETLREFYSAEWDKAHQAYQDEADRYRERMIQQVEEVRNKQEAQRREQEVRHAQHVEALRQEFESSLADLQKFHEQKKQELDNSLKQSEAAHHEKIESLVVQNEDLRNRLREEEERRKALAEKSQKDSRVVYLEQELQSLRVVLEMKTDQLHQQDKKLMQMDKLIDSNLKLEECVKKLQQENEDYKERMDKHAAMSRQLSTEQAVLQKTLQKESKANKRLSMENEELLWKLHNGLSPRNSACFPSSPVSPR